MVDSPVGGESPGTTACCVWRNGNQTLIRPKIK